MSLCRSEKSCRKELSECAMVARQGGGLRNLRRGPLKGALTTAGGRALVGASVPLQFV